MQAHASSELIFPMTMQFSAKDRLSEHPLREELYAEMHSRPFRVIDAPARISHLVIMCDESQKKSQYQHLLSLCENYGVAPPDQDVAFFQMDLNGLQMRREKHLEFIAYTFTSRCDDAEAPFAHSCVGGLPEAWLAGLEGQIITAFHVTVLDVAESGEPDIPQVKQYFDDMRLIGSQPSQGAVQVWTTYQLHDDGYGRFLVYNREMSASQLGRLVQRLVEIETYRLMTLLGLPLARSISPQLRQMDLQLAELTQTLAQGEQQEGFEDAQHLLGRLTDIASQVEAYRAQSTFRFNATLAYQAIMFNNIDELREDEVSGHLTLQEFIGRRVGPAVKTCESVAARLEDLSRRIDRVSDMLRTQVDLSIQGQNQELLSSMDRRSKIQLMMQHTVEGLSVAAISYYTIGLVKIFLGVLYDQGISFDKSLALGISMPLVIIVVAWLTRRIHSKFNKLADDPDSRSGHG